MITCDVCNKTMTEFAGVRVKDCTILTADFQQSSINVHVRGDFCLECLVSLNDKLKVQLVDVCKTFDRKD